MLALAPVPTVGDPIAIASATPVTAEVALVVGATGEISLAYLDASSGRVVTAKIQDPYTISPINPNPYPGVLRSTWTDGSGVQREVETDCKGMTVKNCVRAHDQLVKAMIALYPPK